MRPNKGTAPFPAGDLFGSLFGHTPEGRAVIAKTWKPNQRPISATHAMRLSKERAAVKLNLSVERIADLMGVTHDSLYKWLATGRMPLILLPAFELACGCNYVSEWLAASAGKLVIQMPTGRKGTEADVMQVSVSCATALQLLTDFYANPTADAAAATQAALRTHMEQVACHQANVATYTHPELDFTS